MFIKLGNSFSLDSIFALFLIVGLIDKEWDTFFSSLKIMPCGGRILFLCVYVRVCVYIHVFISHALNASLLLFLNYFDMFPSKTHFEPS